MVKMFYLCKLVTVFGRVTAISRICFVCSISCQAIELKPLLRVPVPRNDAAYSLCGGAAASGHFDKCQRRLLHFTQFHQHPVLSQIIWGSSGTGRLPCPRTSAFRDHHRIMNGLIPSARKGIRGPLPQPAPGHKPVAGRASPQMAPQRFAGPRAAFPRSCRKERRSPGLPPTIL